jgi:hypothetical protein
MAVPHMTFEQFYNRLIDWYLEEERTNPQQLQVFNGKIPKRE